ncbi:putative gtpase-activator protein for ras-like gtpase containing protein [Pseudohyphozyma bogoriensis]|nr:putative gtpase-activator protein for ras-like gtpase containing protein [Pseudohyphozyma bogoriensis]
MAPRRRASPEVKATRSSKRLRLASTAASDEHGSVVAQPISAEKARNNVITFHRNLQAHLVGRLVELLELEEELGSTIESSKAALVDLSAQRTEHAAVMASSLIQINATVDAATNLNHLTRRLSGEAIALSEAVRKFVKRYARLATVFLSDLDTASPPPELQQSAETLFAGHLFAGLFDEITFDADLDYEDEWDKMFAALIPGSNSLSIAESWIEILSTFHPKPDSPISYPRGFLDKTQGFRDEISKIIRSIGLCQLGKMAEIDTALADLNQRATRMRGENQVHWERWRKIEREIMDQEKRLADAQVKLPREEEKSIDHVLQLIILSKGP